MASSLSAVVVIPARYASSRFPGKPLADGTGRPLIQHVYEQARRAERPERVVVATDDERIAEACRAFGAEVAMTPTDCASGTDRVAVAARALPYEVVVNVQGDEPELDPAHIDRAIALLDEPGAEVATLAARSLDEVAFRDPNVVKVVLGAGGLALYFTRTPAPYARALGGGLPPTGFLAHLGLYAYRRDYLQRIARTPPTPLERLECLEQLRVLETGGRIRCAVVDGAAQGVDTPQDYERFVARWNARVSDENARKGGRTWPSTSS